MKGSKFTFSCKVVFLLIVLYAQLVFAGVTGKITGVIIDKDTKLPLVGVNVVLQGTMMGASTDENGRYFILQVSPGVYTLTASMIGYKNISVRNVEVIIDHTTDIDIEMIPEVIDIGEEVVVVAKRPVIQKDITTSTQFVGIEEIAQLPVTDAKEGIMLQTGMIFIPIPVAGGLGGSGRGEQRYYVRGGTQDEVKWFINGVRTSSLLEGRADRAGSFTDVNLHAIEEIQVITSGYNAEYGEAQSGIVNTVTKEGGDRFTGSFEYIYGVPGKHHFGKYLYKRPSAEDYLSHMDHLHNLYSEWYSSFSGSSEDSIAFIENLNEINNEWRSQYPKEFVDHIVDTLWNNYWSTEAQEYRHNVIDSVGLFDPVWWSPYRQENIYDYTKVPDHNIYMSLGGPLFNFGETKATFFLASQFKKAAYVLPRPRDTRDLENITGNISVCLRPGVKLRVSGLYNHETHTTLQEYGLFLNNAKYYRGFGSVLNNYTYNIAAQWSHAFSTKFFYDLKLSWFLMDMKEGPSDYTELGMSENPDIWGYQRYNGFPDEPFDAWAHIIKNHIQAGDISLVGSINWQINEFHFLKSGFEYRYNTIAEIEDYRYPAYSLHPDDWLNRGLHETYHPIQFAVYIQDKMEFESMILNFGARYDYFNPNREWFDFSNLFNLAADPEYSASADLDMDQIDSLGHIKYSFENVLDKPRSPVKSFSMISPRLGVSFPVTDKTLLHFNYGHFYQMPPLDRMFSFMYFRPEYIVKEYINFRDSDTTGHVPSKDGDPERVVNLTLEPLKPEKTISFEVGVKHNFSDFAVLDVTAYYKDVFDQTNALVGLFDRRIYGWDPFKNQITPNVFYTSFLPGDYGDARGFEITFRTLFSRVFTFDINYTYSISTQGRASPKTVKIDGDGNVSYEWDVEVNKRIPVENSYSRPHIVRANFFLRYPDDLKDSGIHSLLKGTSASILFTYVSGQPFTYVKPTDPPDTFNNYRYPATRTVDLRVEKMFTVNKIHNISIYLRVTNLFNRKNLMSFGDIWYTNPDPIRAKYVEEGEVTLVDEYGYDIDWQTWGEPRRIYIGLKYNFH